MFQMLWNMYWLFSCFAAVYIIGTVLWNSKPVNTYEVFQVLKDWLFTQLYVDKFNIRIEQIILGVLLICPLCLAGGFYLLISVVTKQN